jgi:4-amino-4-deoxychorismate lyase
MILVNGHLGEHVRATDRGLAYGDGVFETIAVVGGEPRHWDRHVARLLGGCQRLGIPPPAESILASEIRPLLSDAAQAVLKVIVTRGEGGRGYRPAADPEPTRIMSLHDWPKSLAGWTTTGVDVWVCRTRLGRNPALAGIKHLNRLEQVLASREWPDDRYAEGLMLDETGLLVEGTRTNVFMVSSGRALTPELTHCGVAGIMREIIIRAFSELGVTVEVRNLSLEAALEADELFVCNSVIGVWPVKRISHHRTEEYGVGPLTRKLQDYLRVRGDIS